MACRRVRGGRGPRDRERERRAGRKAAKVCSERAGEMAGGGEAQVGILVRTFEQLSRSLQAFNFLSEFEPQLIGFIFR
jgi:hypothetical protein